MIRELEHIAEDFVVFYLHYVFIPCSDEAKNIWWELLQI